MEYLKRVLRQILKEEAAQDTIMDAVKKKYQVSIKYDGGGVRIIEPSVYGTSSAGNMVLRAYQIDGYTKTHVPAWKEFIVDKIDDWNANKDVSFDEPPSFSKSGAGLSSVFVTSEFEGSNESTPENNNFQNKEINTTQNLKIGKDGNKSSLNDMSRANNFGDSQDNYTSGPVTKGNTETNTNTGKANNKVDYSNVEKNGPVFRGDELKKEPTQDFKNKEEHNDSDSNHEEPDIDFDEEMEKEAEKDKNEEEEI